MATLRVPDKRIDLTNEYEIRKFLEDRGILYDRWSLERGLSPDASDAEVLAAYNSQLTSLMENGRYKAVDVVTVTDQTPNLSAIREKFLREHTHSEDEVRMFVTGEGLFWFHVESPEEEVFALWCQQGDLISVPANTKHWFDLGVNPAVRAIRVFTDQAGWVPHYTNSGIEQRYQDVA